jgi:hypothetical protein
MSSNLIAFHASDTPHDRLNSNENRDFVAPPRGVATPALLHARGWLKPSKAARTVVAPATEPHPYLLVLLADLAIDANRKEEATRLIDAAYAACDQYDAGL